MPLVSWCRYFTACWRLLKLGQRRQRSSPWHVWYCISSCMTDLLKHTEAFVTELTGMETSVQEHGGVVSHSLETSIYQVGTSAPTKPSWWGICWSTTLCLQLVEKGGNSELFCATLKMKMMTTELQIKTKMWPFSGLTIFPRTDYSHLFSAQTGGHSWTILLALKAVKRS